MTHRVALKPSQPCRVWRNQTNTELKRTITIYPCIETLPDGCAIRVFEAPDNITGPPPSGCVPVGLHGDSVALVIPPGHAAFVNFDRGQTSVISVLAEISEEA